MIPRKSGLKIKTRKKRKKSKGIRGHVLQGRQTSQIYSRQIIKQTNNNKSLREKIQNPELPQRLSKMSNIQQQQKLWVCKETRHYDPNPEEKAVNRKCLWDNPDVEFSRQRPKNGYYKYVQRIKGFWFFFFLATPHALKDLAPWPGIEPAPSAMKVQSPNHWTTREFCKGLKETI